VILEQINQDIEHMAQFCACLHSRPADRQTSKHEFYFTLIYLAGQPAKRRNVVCRHPVDPGPYFAGICCQNPGLGEIKKGRTEARPG
ncbi:MAG: hypothetical protein ACN6PR_17905, partial [Achromobacter sp.]